MPKTQRIRPNEDSELYREILTAGALLSGSQDPNIESNDDVRGASNYTTYLEVPTGDLWRKTNGIWGIFANVSTGGGQTYDIEISKPTAADIRPIGAFWYYKPVGSSNIQEVYICTDTGRWGLLDNFERMLEKDLISNNAGGLYGGYSYSQDIEKTAVPGSSTTSYLKKNDYLLPTLPSYTNYNATSGKDFSNRFTNGSEINGGEFGIMKCVDNTTNNCQWTSDLGMGNSYINMPATQRSEISQPIGVRTVRLNVAPAIDGSIRPEEKYWAVDNWGATTDPDTINQGTDKGYFYGSLFTNLTSGDIFIGTADAATNLVWRKIYNATAVTKGFYGASIFPSIQDNFTTSWAQVNFGTPTINNNPLNLNFVQSGTWDIQYTGPDGDFDIDFNISASTMNNNGLYEYALFIGSVDAGGANRIINSTIILGIGNAGVFAVSSGSSSTRISLTNGDVVLFGRKGDANGTFIEPEFINISFKQV